MAANRLVAEELVKPPRQTAPGLVGTKSKLVAAAVPIQTGAEGEVH